MKEYLEDIGIVEKNSQKVVIKEVYVPKFIINENIWLVTLNDRKLTSYVYKEEIAEEIAERIVNYYIT
ncbi:nucleotidyltransferase substrate binding protein, HI0074 family [Anaerobranca gottschalkii DSM 13577]|uniref:Nucleotidyltransferase substrate binding protein, HI0074 family n=2 Tax=Anaerobranca gottschalkii TaxID=108328 RepID=A0A1H9ZH85_9FIRM|nr:nucleotidyltransferase substrate binding protein, HI0074 family [Anaerobranca gottschalkii DSM 13577]